MRWLTIMVSHCFYKKRNLSPTCPRCILKSFVNDKKEYIKSGKNNN